MENVIIHVKTTKFVQSANDVSIICVQKFATQTTTAYLEKFVMKVVFVSLVVHQMLIVHTPKFVFNLNVNVPKDISTPHKVVSILMNALIKFVMLLQSVKMSLAHSNVFVQKIQSEIPSAMDVVNQVNVARILIVLIILHVKMENVSIHVP